jgi:peptide deformylase
MILELAYYGDPILRKKAEPILEFNDEVKQLAADLIETMHHTKNGVGLATPQVRRSLAMFVVQFPNPANKEKWTPGANEVVINPKILSFSDEEWFYSEGCLSLPGLYCKIKRPLKIKLQFQNLQGEILVKDFEGYEARMLLHENDHLNGVLFIDRLDPKERKRIEQEVRAIKQKYQL